MSQNECECGKYLHACSKGKCKSELDTIEQLTKERDEAINRINDMLMGDDGQAYKEARKFIARHSGEEK